MTDTMRSNFKKRATAVAVASCLSFASCLASAAGLGKITVFSGLGQPLRAEIELNATPAELAGMSARLARPEAFREAGVDLASGYNDLRFSIEKRANGRPVIKVSSVKPVNEPFLDFLVELNWPAGPILREYTFLLDPPEVAARAAAREAPVAQARVVETVRGSAAAPTVSTRPDASTATRTAGVSRKAENAGSYVVQPGDTLRRIAGETRHEGVSLEQMLIGLFRSNPDAFIGDNINRLKAGAILNVPDKAAVSAIPEAEARKVYVAQAADWNAYRERLAAAATGAPAKEVATAQSAGGKISASVEDKASPVDQAKDQVKVARTEVPSKGVTGGKPGGAGEEELIAKERALKEAEDRLALLEKNVGELQKLVDMKTQRLAELQQQALGKPEEAKPAVSAEPPKAIDAPKTAEPAPVADTAKPVDAAKPVEATKAADEPKPAEVAKAPEAKPPAPPVKPVPAPAAAPESQLTESLPLLAGGGLLALLAGFFLLRRRRSESEDHQLTAAAPGPSSLGPNSVFRMTGGQSVDTGNVPLQTGDFSQTGPGTIDTDEVDPVAEADVYMAYGRDAQAEEILIEALRKDPQRVAIHGKLLEIYANRKSIKQFDTLASELYAQTGGVGSDWEKVLAMGASLDPENPLYNAARANEPAEEAEAPAAPEPAGRATVVIPGTLGQMAAAASAAAAAEAASALEQPVPEWSPGAGEVDFSNTVVTSNIAALDLGTPEASENFTQTPAGVSELPGLTFPGVESLDFDLGEKTPEALVASDANAEFSPEGTLVADTNKLVQNFSDTFAGADDLAATAVGPASATTTLLDFELDVGAADAGTLVNPNALQESLITESGSETLVVPFTQHDQSVGESTVTNGQVGINAGGDVAQDDFDVQFSESVFLERPPENDFDMTSINLDLGADVPEPTQVVDLSGEFGSGVAISGQSVEEAGTKLALAKAYEEMGDNDQARELLQEVIAEGSGDLVEQARQILDRLRG